ncbi:hypothetical protein F4803DRAFT_565284 [Xylaria telfairii]|nr:hypothetical protein F4803DRAFT_565284 [Xylaria telfairii]
MAETSFTPYWQSLEPPTGPNSWVFFTVAKLASGYQPVAAVSSIGGCPEESLQGTPLTVCCQRIVTIFSDPANHTAIRGELALADAYYATDEARRDRLVPVELPELTRRHPGDPRRFPPWDRTSVVPFPFISASLLQGVAFDPRLARGAPARPEPLATVYRDTDLEWGMVVVDITDLKKVRYGIVGFAVAMAKFVPSLAAEKRPFHFDARFHFEEGPLRVMDEVRPRKALSATEYMAKFNYDSVDYDTSHHPNDMQILDSIPLVDSAALSPVWATAESALTSLSSMTVKHQSSNMQQDEATKNLIHKTLHFDDFDISVFDDVRHLPGFKSLVQQALQGCREILDDTRAVGRLIRIAYTLHDSHLSLELLENLSAKTVSSALDDSLEVGGTITSLSLCTDGIHSTPAELATALSRATSLKEIYLLQNPTRESDALSAQILTALATQTEVLSRVKVVFAGAYSSALRKRFWLSTSPSLIPRQAFPIQQIFARHERAEGRLVSFEHNYIHLGDGLLKPERFATGFLLWLSTLEPMSYYWFEEKAPFFAFSSAPASLTPDLLSTAQVTPILCENFALPFCLPDHTVCSPRVRDLVPSSWTALVSQESNPGAHGTHRHIRYAFVRVRGQQSIMVEDPPTSLPGPEELEVLGLKEFLSLTAPEVDPSIIDACLDNTARKIVALNTSDAPWESGVEPLSVLGEADASSMLLEFLNDARTLNKKHREAMEKDPENWSWYPELSDAST